MLSPVFAKDYNGKWMSDIMDKIAIHTYSSCHLAYQPRLSMSTDLLNFKIFLVPVHLLNQVMCNYPTT